MGTEHRQLNLNKRELVLYINCENSSSACNSTPSCVYRMLPAICCVTYKKASMTLILKTSTLNKKNWLIGQWTNQQPQPAFQCK